MSLQKYVCCEESTITNVTTISINNVNMTYPWRHENVKKYVRVQYSLEHAHCVLLIPKKPTQVRYLYKGPVVVISTSAGRSNI